MGELEIQVIHRLKSVDAFKKVYSALHNESNSIQCCKKILSKMTVAIVQGIGK